MTVALIVVLAGGCRPHPVGVATDAIDTAAEPVQEMVEDAEPVRLEAGNYNWEIRPLARFSAGGVVVGRERYHMGWASDLVPCDLALAWGELVASGAYRDLSWSQGNRWYFWRWSGRFAYDNTFIARHSANVHIIPSTSTLRQAVCSLGPGDLVKLTGSLVHAEGAGENDRVVWRSSLSRDDTGDGSCELLYLESLQIGPRLYR